MRRTETNLETMAEKVIRDFWTDDTQEERTELADKWIGKTIFDLQHPTPKDGYEWVEHRLTKIEENTGRPGTMWPEEYWRLSKNKKRQACIEADQVLEARRQARIRGGHRTTNIPVLESDDYLKTVKDAIDKLKRPAPPAMLVKQLRVNQDSEEDSTGASDDNVLYEDENVSSDDAAEVPSYVGLTAKASSSSYILSLIHI